MPLPTDPEGMNLQLVGSVVVGAALIGWIGYRQTTWRPVSIGGMYRTGLILAVVGVAAMMQTATALRGPDVAVLVVELVISLGIGAWMGTIARFRPLDPPRHVGRSGQVATQESRTGWWGLALWLVMIAVRIGMDAAAAAMGVHAASSMGVIVLLIAANRVARTAVIAARVPRRSVARTGSVG